MFHLDIHSRWELQVFLDDNDSDFLSKWIAEDDISNAVKQLMSEEEELESIQSNLESNRAIDATEDPNNLELHSSIQRMQEELLNPDLPKFKKDFLKRELRVWELELAYRQRQPEGFSKPRKSRESNGGTRVTFEVESAEFSKAIQLLRPARARGKKAQADFVDINAYTSDIEVVAPGVSFRLNAAVIHSGYVRVPYLTFEWFSRALKTLRQSSAQISVSGGQVRVANLRFSHPDISSRLIGSRIADLPIDATLPDVLALLTTFNTEELSDSGLLARVLAAQEDATKLIDQAMKVLKPFEIKREDLSQFIVDAIKMRAKTHQ